MTSSRWPDLRPAALRRLAVEMTPAEVEAIVGPCHRPNLYRGRRYHAWIGEGAMLRAFFDGPGGTLSAAVLDVPKEQRVLDLGKSGRSCRKKLLTTKNPRRRGG